MSSLRPRVLLADDYPDLLVAFERFLAPSCEVVGCVADGAAVLEAVARLQPDVVVVDLLMAPSNGLEVCRSIKQVAPETLVVVVSASGDPGLARQALDAGASAFVSKFAAVDELIPAIQGAMASRSRSD